MPTPWVAQQHCLVLCRQASSVQGAPGGAGSSTGVSAALYMCNFQPPFYSWVHLSHGVAALGSQLSSTALRAVFIIKLLSQ